MSLKNVRFQMLHSVQSGHWTFKTSSLCFGTVTEQLPIHARGNGPGIFLLTILKEIHNKHFQHCLRSKYSWSVSKRFLLKSQVWMTCKKRSTWSELYLLHTHRQCCSFSTLLILLILLKHWVWTQITSFLSWKHS